MDIVRSVIVSLYNTEKYLIRCINRIDLKTHHNLKLVDDRFPDNCPQICNEWANIDSRIRVINKKRWII